jgi:hypothetical protein
MDAAADPRISRHLNHYCDALYFWTNEQGDIHLMAHYRELLQEELPDMAQEERLMLDRLDAKAKRVVDAYAGSESWDLAMLREMFGTPGNGR